MNVVSARRHGLHGFGQLIDVPAPPDFTDPLAYAMAPQSAIPAVDAPPDYSGFTYSGAPPAPAAPAVDPRMSQAATQFYASLLPGAPKVVDMTAASPMPVGLPPGPAPRVNVPLTSSSFGQFFTGSTLVSGLPNWALLAGGLLMIPLLGGLVGGKRRR